MKRRNFFKSIGGVAGALAIPPVLEAFAPRVYNPFEWPGNPTEDKFWTAIRKQFLLPKDYSYLNTAGLGSSPVPILDRVHEEMKQKEIKPGPTHDLTKWKEVKSKCASLLGSGIKREEIAFIGCATEGINIILNGLSLKRGDEIITSTHEHIALLVPLMNKLVNEGIIFKMFEPDMVDGKGNISRIEQLITERTRLIFVSHITCTTGQVMPLKEISELARSRDILFAVDGAQGPGQIAFNLAETGADFYTFSAHKWLLAPMRTGILYVNEKKIDRLKPTVVGAYSAVSLSLEEHILNLSPDAQRYEYGTQNDSLFFGLAGALDFISSIGIRDIALHNKNLSEAFYKKIAEVPGVELLSPQQEEWRSATVSFRMKGIISEDIAGTLTNKGIRVRVVKEASLNSLRVSFHIYNNQKDIEKFLECITWMVKDPTRKKIKLSA